MPFAFEPTEIPGVVHIKPRAFVDARGYFMEMYKSSDFAAHGLPASFVQINLSHSVRGVLRGLHYQKHPAAQGKLVAVVQGAIFDVGVDIRQGSPTFGRWVGRVLSAENHAMLYIPPGFAHGFCVLSESADVVYQVTHEFAPALDRAILWCDPELAIAWPVEAPRVSARDAAAPRLRDADNNFVYG